VTHDVIVVLAALAAGRQNHFFDFAQLAYFNQGGENSGWLDDNFIRAAYSSIPGSRSGRRSRLEPSRRSRRRPIASIRRPMPTKCRAHPRCSSEKRAES
jgi:hypothetical protein